ncbi:MAG: IclR family transcriptional regulator [Burkholderiales bacterium]|nr:IclR family transcriptional regulator [Burkholderiales bacterium]
MARVRTADRTLAIFETFETACRPMVLTELAARAQVPVSSCHGLVRTLLERGYLYSLGRRKDIYPTRRLLDVAQTIVHHDPLLERIGPVLQALRDNVRETVILGKRQGDLVLYLEVIPGLHTVRYAANTGEFKPLHSSAIGKALLGALSTEALADWLRTHPLPVITPRTLVDPTRLHADLARSRARGYYMTDGENVSDVAALAVSLLVHGEVLGFAIAGPTHRMNAQIDENAAHLLDAQRAIAKIFER